jgi:aspartate beta-hydroxylase
MGLEKQQYPELLQRPKFYLAGLQASPWHDLGRFEWTAKLEASYAVIRNEALILGALGAFGAQPEGVGGDWATCYLYWLGEKHEQNCSLCPVTTRIVETIPGATSAGLVYFAALSPQTRLEPHCGPTNTRLRCHLGLVTPPDCGIRVGTETRSWKAGTVLVFDDSFEHEAWNGSTETRIVLVFDVWHPDLTSEEVQAIEKLSRYLGEF